MRGGGQCCQDQLQAVRIGVAADFTLAQFQRVQGRFHLVLGDAVGRDIPKRGQYQLFDLPGTVGIATLQSAHEAHFAV